jgi:hypothetical protein
MGGLINQPYDSVTALKLAVQQMDLPTSRRAWRVLARLSGRHNLAAEVRRSNAFSDWDAWNSTPPPWLWLQELIIYLTCYGPWAPLLLRTGRRVREYDPVLRRIISRHETSTDISLAREMCARAWSEIFAEPA